MHLTDLKAKLVEIEELLASLNGQLTFTDEEEEEYDDILAQIDNSLRRIANYAKQIRDCGRIHYFD